MNRRLLPFLLLLALLPACREGSAPEPAPTPPARDGRPNVLLVTLDTTRADRLGCYGYEPARTPHLDSLAAEGVRFERAVSPVPLTLPAHASILTGLHPPSHGIRVNARGPLPGDLPVLPELLAEQGYRTGAFLGAWVLKGSWGLDRGFQRYDDHGWSDREENHFQERSAGKVCDAALAWLRREDPRPFLAWVHLYDPHTPYAPPPEFRDVGAHPYDGEIAYMDAQIGRLLGWLDEAGLRESTLVVAVGDHGEAFEEHGEIEHGLLLHEVTLRVPLLLRWPDRLPAARVVQSGASLVDLAPTVLELLGRPVPGSMQGQSLAELLDGGEGAPRREYAETDYPLEVFGWAPLRSYAEPPWKYVAGPRPELYDLSSDPGELVNLAGREPERAERLRTGLLEFQQGLPETNLEAEPLSPEEEAALESLGYLSGSSGGAPDPVAAVLPDPRERLPVFRGIRRAMTLDRQRRYDEVLRVLEPLRPEAPGQEQLLTLLGEAYLNLGRAEEALGIYRRCLELRPEDPAKMGSLASALVQLDRTEEAERLFRRVIEMDPRRHQAYAGLGLIQVQRGRPEEALATYRQGLAAVPEAPGLLANLGILLHNLKRPREAVEPLERALELDPDQPAAQETLWRVWFDLGDRSRARRALILAVEQYPRNPELQRQLIGLLATSPEAGAQGRREALRRAEELCTRLGENPENLEMLALACSVNGQTPRARDLLKQAISLALEQGDEELAHRLSGTYRSLSSRRR